MDEIGYETGRRGEQAGMMGRLRAASKLATIGVLALLLLIPLSWIGSLVHERLSRLEEAQREIAATWSGSQTIAGPLLVVPISEPVVSVAKDGTQQISQFEREAFFLPREVHWSGTVAPQVRSRGIFEAVVWESELAATATFRPLDLAELGGSELTPHWERARLVIGVGDNRGIGSDLAIDWGGRALEPRPGGLEGENPFSRGIHAAIPMPDDPSVLRLEVPPLSIRATLRGSNALEVIPVAETSMVELASPWPDPSFGGSFLPDRREVGAEGFTASWAVPWFARSAEQAWVGRDRAPFGELAAAAFGVRFALPAGGYQQVERAGKYGLLFLVLTFAAFFIAEIRAPRRLHPIHYGLVGAALVVFYLLLLALSEHVGFDGAYAIAAGGVVGLVTGYARAILPGGRALALGGGVAGLYAFLWVALASEDHALLLGSVGVFLALAGLMWATRRIDWSTLEPVSTDGG